MQIRITKEVELLLEVDDETFMYAGTNPSDINQSDLVNFCNYYDPYEACEYAKEHLAINEDIKKIEYRKGAMIDPNNKSPLVTISEKEIKEIEAERDRADRCYECGGYGDDYSVDDDGELVSNCDSCPFNDDDDD